MAIDWDNFVYPDREGMIDWLCNNDEEYIMLNENGPELLQSYLRVGFKGYMEFTDEELRNEYRDAFMFRDMMGRAV